MRKRGWEGQFSNSLFLRSHNTQFFLLAGISEAETTRRRTHLGAFIVHVVVPRVREASTAVGPVKSRLATSALHRQRQVPSR